MKVFIGENIKKLRITKGLTQEELADFLHISFQTVSKWERNISYPDVEIIPIIANYFGVTIDELMGNSKVKAEEIIVDYLNEYEKLELLGENEKKNILAKNAYEEFPYDFRIINMYRHSLVCGRDKKDFGDTKTTIKFLCNKILEGCTDNYYRQCAISSLLLISETKDEQEKYLSMLNGDFNLLQGEMKESFYFDKGDMEKAIKACQENLQEYLSWLIFKIEVLCSNMPLEQKISANNKIIDIIKILFENEDYGEYLFLLASKYEENARYNFSRNEIESGLSDFEKSIDYLIKYYLLPNEISHRSMLFNKTIYCKDKRNTLDNEYKSFERYLKDIETKKEYEIVRNNEIFNTQVDRIKKYIL